jgi:hypothetical protein
VASPSATTGRERREGGSWSPGFAGEEEAPASSAPPRLLPFRRSRRRCGSRFYVVVRASPSSAGLVVRCESGRTLRKKVVGAPPPPPRCARARATPATPHTQTDLRGEGIYFCISSESKCYTQIDLRREGMYFYISSESKCISSLPILLEIKTTMHIINS